MANFISNEKKIQILSALVEGNSLRSITRMFDVHRTTVMKVLIESGEKAKEILDEKIVYLKCRYVQCDEIWCFVGKKQKMCTPSEIRKGELGDQYIFVAMDSDTKLVITHLIGKRNTKSCTAFIEDLSNRIPRRFQLSTDAFNSYRRAVDEIFGIDIDFGTVNKHYANDVKEEKRYSPAKVTSVSLAVIAGHPVSNRISTSHIERQNLTMRMQMRRLTRLTNAFSKKLYNLECAIALHFFYYNFIRIHQTLRVTPAMEAKITGHLWSWKDFLEINVAKKAA